MTTERDRPLDLVSSDVLGPLPKAEQKGWIYTSAQMKAYAQRERAAEREKWRATVEALLPMAEESVTRPNLDPVCLDARGLLKRA